MRARFRTSLFILLLLATIHPCLAGKKSQIPEQDFSAAIIAFSQYAEKQIHRDQIPGMSIGFLKDDFVWTQGFGFADLENSVPAKPESSYRLASITKTITAIAVLQLVEAGKIDLDHKVQTYVPYFPQKKWPITIRQLLGHLGGISHYRDLDKEIHFKDHKNTREALAVFQDFDLAAKPGTRYLYSSYGFNLLGAVIEGASGQTYGDFIREHIFAPLDMKSSRLDSPTELIPHRVKGYRLLGDKVVNSEFVDVSSRFAGGGTRSSVADLMKYAQGILAGKLLQPDSWQTMFSSQATQGGYLTGYGMGWNVQPLKGHYQVSHGGSQPETRTYILLFPAEKFAVAVAANLEQADLTPYIRRLAELVLNEDLDSTAYLRDPWEQALYNAALQTFSMGLSQYSFRGGITARNIQDQKHAFDYFNQALDPNALKQDPRAARKKLAAGIHPAAEEAFSKVGSYMASKLVSTYGKDRLKIYRQDLLAFFSDYLAISDNPYSLNPDFSRLVLEWKKDWTKTYAPSFHLFHITPETDFSALGPKLQQDFLQARIYPDFSREMVAAAKYHLKRKEYDISTEILELSTELYPSDPISWFSLAEAHLWSGNLEKAMGLFRKAHRLNPDIIDEVDTLSVQLWEAKKIDELLVLAEVSLELFPKSSRKRVEIARIYLNLGEKDLAIKYFRKALKLNPRLKEVEAILSELEKKK